MSYPRDDVSRPPEQGRLVDENGRAGNDAQDDRPDPTEAGYGILGWALAWIIGAGLTTGRGR